MTPCSLEDYYQVSEKYVSCIFRGEEKSHMSVLTCNVWKNICEPTLRGVRNKGDSEIIKRILIYYVAIFSDTV
jgi:hypothetical protein